MLVPDPMHVVLEGVVHYHCRRVLKIDTVEARKRDAAPFAFKYDWLPLVPATIQRAPENVVPKLADDRKIVANVQRLLQRELDDPDPDAADPDREADDDDHDDGSSDDSYDGDDDVAPPAAKRPIHPDEILTTDALIRKLSNYKKPVLVWVCWTLNLRAVPPKPPPPPRKPKISPEEWDALPWEKTLYWKATSKAALVQTLVNWVRSSFSSVLELELRST
jgi:hypothetical protein